MQLARLVCTITLISATNRAFILTGDIEIVNSIYPRPSSDCLVALMVYQRTADQWQSMSREKLATAAAFDVFCSLPDWLQLHGSNLSLTGLTYLSRAGGLGLGTSFIVPSFLALPAATIRDRVVAFVKKVPQNEELANTLVMNRLLTLRKCLCICDHLETARATLFTGIPITPEQCAAATDTALRWALRIPDGISLTDDHRALALVLGGPGASKTYLSLLLKTCPRPSTTMPPAVAGKPDACGAGPEVPVVSAAPSPEAAPDTSDAPASTTPPPREFLPTEVEASASKQPAEVVSPAEENTTKLVLVDTEKMPAESMHTSPLPLTSEGVSPTTSTTSPGPAEAGHVTSGTGSTVSAPVSIAAAAATKTAAPPAVPVAAKFPPTTLPAAPAAATVPASVPGTASAGAPTVASSPPAPAIPPPIPVAAPAAAASAHGSTGVAPAKTAWHLCLSEAQLCSLAKLPWPAELAIRVAVNLQLEDLNSILHLRGRDIYIEGDQVTICIQGQRHPLAEASQANGEMLLYLRRKEIRPGYLVFPLFECGKARPYTAAELHTMTL